MGAAGEADRARWVRVAALVVRWLVVGAVDGWQGEVSLEMMVASFLLLLLLLQVKSCELSSSCCGDGATGLG